jgi:hypothetical protein
MYAQTNLGKYLSVYDQLLEKAEMYGRIRDLSDIKRWIQGEGLDLEYKRDHSMYTHTFYNSNYHKVKFWRLI